MADIFVRSSININDLTYETADNIFVENKAVLTCNSDNIVKVSAMYVRNGELLIDNSANPTTILKYTTNTTGSDIIAQQAGKVTMKGAWYQVGIGDGTAGQSFSFASGELLKVATTINDAGKPTRLDVETGNGTGVFEQWMVVGTVGETTNFSESIFDGTGTALGKVLFWNNTTKALYAGDGTNGSVIPNGAIVRIPNVLIDCNVSTATNTSRCQMVCTQGATFNADTVMFSDNIYLALSGGKDCELKNIGTVGYWTISNFTGDVVIENCCCLPRQYVASGILRATSSNNTGTSYWDGFLAYSGEADINSIFNLGVNFGVKKMDNISIYSLQATNAATDDTVVMTAQYPYYDTLTYKNWKITGRTELNDMINCTFVNLQTCLRMGAVTDFDRDGSYVLYSTNGANIKVIGYSNLSDRYDVGTFLYQSAANTGNEFYNVDCRNNTHTRGRFITVFIPTNMKMYNCSAVINQTVQTMGLIYNATVGYPTGGEYFEMVNVRASFVGTGLARFWIQSNAMHDVVSINALEDLIACLGQKNYTFGNWMLGNSANGYLVLNSVMPCDEAVTTGSAFVDGGGNIKMEATADTFECETRFACHAIEAFDTAKDLLFSYTQAGAQSTWSATAPSVTFQYALKRPSTTSYPAYTALSMSNIQASLAALTDYDSDKEGLDVKIKGTLTIDDTTFLFTGLAIPTTLDTDWVANDSTVTIEGTNTTDIIEMRKSSDDSLLDSFVGDGVKSIYVGDLFDNQAYFVRKTSADVTMCSTSYSPITLTIGNNGVIKLYMGEEIQVAGYSIIDTINTKVDTKPTLAQMEASTVLAKEATCKSTLTASLAGL